MSIAYTPIPDKFSKNSLNWYNIFVEQVTCRHCGNKIRLKIIPLSSDFEQTANVVDYSNNGGFDSINFVISGLFAGLIVFIFSWWYGLRLTGVFFLATSLGVGLGLHILKLWLYRPTSAAPREVRQDSNTSLRIEHIDSTGQHWFIDELKCDIELTRLQLLGKALLDEDWKWSRRLVTNYGISQAKYHQLKEELLRLNYLKPLPNGRNGYQMTGRGRRVFYQLSS